MKIKTFLSASFSLALLLFAGNVAAMEKETSKVSLSDIKKYLSEDRKTLDFSKVNDYDMEAAEAFWLFRDGILEKNDGTNPFKRIRGIVFPTYLLVEKDMMLAFSELKSLKSIDCNATSNMTEEVVECIPDVEKLNLNGCTIDHDTGIGNKELKSLQKKRKLKTLGLGRLEIDDDIFKLLPKTIENLDIFKTKITDNAIPIICKYLPNLKKIDVRACSKLSIKELGALEKVDVRTGLYSPEIFEKKLHQTVSLGGEKNELSLVGSEITDEAFWNERSEEVETLNLSFAKNLRNKCLRNLHIQFPNLKKLIVIGCNFTILTLYDVIYDYKNKFVGGSTDLIVVTGLN